MNKNGSVPQFIASLIAWPLEAWGLMLTLGIIHRDVYPPVHAIGYGWTAFALTATIPLVTVGRATAQGMAIKRGPTP